jgi:hypothetical protein
MLDGDIFDLTRTGPVDLTEANALVGILNRITLKHNKKVNELITQLEAFGPEEREKTTEIEAVVSREIEEWNGKIRKLGGVPKGLWLVDIDAGDGYYCWKFPEVEIGYWHDYKSGYAGRVSLTERAKRTDAHRLSTDQHTSW